MGKASAVSPDLVAVVQSFSDRALAERMAPLASVGSESVADVVGRLLAGMSLADVLSKKGSNGAKQLPPKK